MKRLEMRLREAAKGSGVLLDVIEKDYAQSYILAGLLSRPELKNTLIFKGGTALKKVFFGCYRFSEDLDFSAMNAPNRDDLEVIVGRGVTETARLLQEQGRFTTVMRRLRESGPHPGG